MESNRYRLPENVLKRIQLILDNTPSFRLNPGIQNPDRTAVFWQTRLGRIEVYETSLYQETHLVISHIELSPTTGLSREELRLARGKALGTMTLSCRGRIVAQAILQATGRTRFACAWIFWCPARRVPTGKLKVELT